MRTAWRNLANTPTNWADDGFGFRQWIFTRVLLTGRASRRAKRWPAIRCTGIGRNS